MLASWTSPGVEEEDDSPTKQLDVPSRRFLVAVTDSNRRYQQDQIQLTRSRQLLFAVQYNLSRGARHNPAQSASHDGD